MAGFTCVPMLAGNAAKGGRIRWCVGWMTFIDLGVSRWYVRA